jgi:hypothetical protein
MHQQLWGHKAEEKLYVGVHEQKRLNTTGLEYEQDMNTNRKKMVNRENASTVIIMLTF